MFYQIKRGFLTWKTLLQQLQYTISRPLYTSFYCCKSSVGYRPYFKNNLSGKRNMFFFHIMKVLHKIQLTNRTVHIIFLFFFFFFFILFLILPGCSFKCYHLFSHEAQGQNVPNSLTVGMGFHCSYVPSGT